MNRTLLVGLAVVCLSPTASATDAHSEVLSALAIVEDSTRSSSERANACATLVQYANPEDERLSADVVSVLGRVVGDTDTDDPVRRAALLALYPYGRHVREIVPRLRAVVRDPRSRTDRNGRATLRDFALDLLARCGEAGAPVLAEMLTVDDASLQSRVVLHLAEMGPIAAAAIPALRECSQADDLEFRVRAAEALIHIATPGGSADAIHLLGEMCSCKSREARDRAWDALARLGPRAAPAVPALRRTFKPDHPDGPALPVILGMGPAARELLPEVRGRMERPRLKSIDRINFLESAALLWLVGRDRVGLSILLDAAEHGDAWATSFSLRMLGETGRGEPEVWRGLHRLRGRIAGAFVPNLAVALCQTAPITEVDGLRFDGRIEAVNDLVPQLDRDRSNVFRALTRLRGDGARVVPNLRKLLAEGESLSEEMITALGDIGWPARLAVPRLWQLANDPKQTDQIRRAAALAVARIDPSRTDAGLRLHFQLEPSTLDTLREVLTELGPRAKVVVPFLRQRIGQPNRNEYLEAAAILWAIDPDEARRLGLPRGNPATHR